MSTTFAGFPASFGAPISSQGADYLANNKPYPGFLTAPTETFGLAGGWREVNGTYWTLQNADYTANGWMQFNSSVPSWAFALLSGGGFAMYKAPPGSPTGFTWTVVFEVDASGSIVNGGGFAFAFNSNLSPLIYNYGNYVNAPALGNAANTAALATMLTAMANPPAGANPSGMAWFPNYEFNVNATQAGLLVPPGSILQSLGNGGDNTSLFNITSVDNAGDTLFTTAATHTSGGTYFRNMSFQWTTKGSVNDLCINAGSWGVKIQDCTFTDCPTAVAFGGNVSDTAGLGCTMERCVVRYGYGAGCPNNSVAVIMAGEQAQILGPSEILQQPAALGGPTGCVGLGWGGGLAGSEHQILSGIHISSWTWGIDFSNGTATNGTSFAALQGGVQKFTIRDVQVNTTAQALTLVPTIANNANIYIGTIEGNTFYKAQGSVNDNHAIVLVDTRNASGGSNNQINGLSFTSNNIFSNVSSLGSSNGVAANNQYGLELRGGSALSFIGGKIANVGNKATNTGGTWSDGSANVCISDGPFGVGPFGGGGPGNTTFSSVVLGPTFGGGVVGGGSTGAGPSQFGILVTANLTNGPITFDNCILLGFSGTGQAPVAVTGTIGVGTFFVRNCMGYNDQDTQIATAAQVGANAASAYNAATLGGINYYGPSYIQYQANATTGGTLVINGHAPTTLLANQSGFIWLNSPYDAFHFSQAPAVLNWRGR